MKSPVVKIEGDFKQLQKGLEATEMLFLIRMLKISRIVEK